jgi:hypothetical protein
MIVSSAIIAECLRLEIFLKKEGTHAAHNGTNKEGTFSPLPTFLQLSFFFFKIAVPHNMELIYSGEALLHLYHKSTMYHKNPRQSLRRLQIRCTDKQLRLA